MLILSLDCAGSGCGVCLWKDGQILAQTEESMDRGQDRRLIPLVNDTMQNAKLDFADLDRIAVTRGPGSFTGLRIGLAAARGIGFAAGKPVIGIDRFEIYRRAVQSPDLLVVINSRRQELYCRFYPQSDTAGEPGMMTEKQITEFLADKKDAVTAGDVPGIPRFQAAMDKETALAAILASKADPKDPTYLPRPLYIRPPDVTFPKNKSA